MPRGGRPCATCERTGRARPVMPLCRASSSPNRPRRPASPASRQPRQPPAPPAPPPAQPEPGPPGQRSPSPARPARRARGPRPAPPRTVTYPFFRISVQLMIAKTLFFAKTFYSYSTGNLRGKKSLRDHQTGRNPAYRPQGSGRTSRHASKRVSRPARAGTTAGNGTTTPGRRPRRETPGHLHARAGSPPLAPVTPGQQPPQPVFSHYRHHRINRTCDR
jgi:hypothetical protein